MSSVAPLSIALVGNPNCGKTALFNRLTGSRQKVANYAGVTVERKEGRFLAPSGRLVRVLPEHTVAAAPLHAIYPHKQHLAPRVRLFVEFLRERLQQAWRW